jgi:uncharacterized protein (TIGR03435 family)
VGVLEQRCNPLTRAERGVKCQVGRDLAVIRMHRHLKFGNRLLLAALAVGTIAVVLISALANPLRANAQSTQQAAANVSFDVASVKVSDSPVISTRFERSGGHILWTTDLWDLVKYAYHVQNWQISGSLPGSRYGYTIEAVTDANATDDQIRLMFQSLLADRFKMVVHRTSKDAQGYALTVAKGGPKLQQATDGKAPPMPAWLPEAYRSANLPEREHDISDTLPGDGVALIIGRRVTLQDLSDDLSAHALQAPVFNLTGLTGEYYFAFEFAAGDSPTATDVPTLSGALKELGLNFEKRTGPVEILVVDHVEKVPTEN